MLSPRELSRVDNTLSPEFHPEFHPELLPKVLPLPLLIFAISAVDYMVIST